MGETDERQLKNRFSELAARADRQCCWTNTDFLSLAEQDTLLRMREGAKFVLDGGYENAERRIAFFGSEEDFGKERKCHFLTIQQRWISTQR